MRNICQKCGGNLKEIKKEEDWIYWKCDNCKRTFRSCGGRTEVYSRVVGFIRPVNQWNDGKQEEWKERVTFDKSIKQVESEIRQLTEALSGDKI